MDATFVAFFLFSFLTLTSAQLSSPSPPPASTTPIPPSTACNSTPDPSFCRSVLPPSGAQSLQSYGRFSLAKSLTKAYNFLSLIDHYRALGASLPAPAARALDDCHLLADLNIDFLTSACKSLNSTSTTLLDPDAQQIHTLISALLTNHQTCIDGLQDADKTNAVSGVLIPSIVNGTKLFSVSLALFTKAWVPHRKLKESSIKHLATKMFHPTPMKGRRHLLFHEAKISSDGRLPLTMSEKHRAVIEHRMGRRLLQSSESVLIKATVVVSQDGTGNFTTISDAVASAPNKTDGSDGYYLIFVSAGIYQEYVSVPKNKRYIMMIGDGINQTIVTGNHNNVDSWTTFNSATFAVVGQGFVGINMTFQNTAGAIKHQAVAVRNGADLSTLYLCSFEGYQDTLYAHSMRQFYTQCDIYGTVDYIFGNSAVVFQNCNMYSRLPMQGQQNTITAQGRIDPNQNTGISIQGGDFLAAADLAANSGSTLTFLGRPWKNYSRTVIMDAFMDGLIQPAGWLPWDGDFALSTLYYAEYNNSGPGSNTIGRVTWPGYHVLTNSTEVMNFTVSNFIMGDYWIPQTGVPYTGGLL